MKTILVTPQFFSSIFFNKNLYKKKYLLKILPGPVNQDTLKKNLRNVDGCIIGSEIINDETIKESKNLKGIVRFGTNLDNISLGKNLKKKVSIYKLSKHLISKAVAKHTLSLILCITNRLQENFYIKKNNVWKRFYNISADNCPIGIIGLGKVGKIVANYLYSLGFEIFYYSKKPKKSKYNYCKTIKELILKVKIVTIHISLNEETKNLIDGKYLRLMKNKYLVNTSRGEIVDEDNLYRLLKKKYILGAALDVFKYEPNIKTSKKVRELNNVIFSCHSAAYDISTLNKMTKESFDHLKKCLKK